MVGGQHRCYGAIQCSAFAHLHILLCSKVHSTCKGIKHDLRVQLFTFNDLTVDIDVQRALLVKLFPFKFKHDTDFGDCGLLICLVEYRIICIVLSGLPQMNGFLLFMSLLYFLFFTLQHHPLICLFLKVSEYKRIMTEISV